MLLTSSLNQLAQAGIRRVALACGVFDSVHRGHQQILQTLLTAAGETGARPVVLTFSPHPMKILAPARAPKLICSEEHKLLLLQEQGIEAIVVQPFTPDYANLEPELFIDRLLHEPNLTITSLCVGRRWRFGHAARGDTNLLQALGKDRGLVVHAVPEVEDQNGKISSSHIRSHLERGELDAVRAQLGRPFSIYGEVTHGKGIATGKLHYATANVRAANEQFPPCGIYAANAVLRTNGLVRRLPGVLYLGFSPTFVDDKPLLPFVEIHIFDFQENLYGARIEVEFLAFLRGDRKFASAQELSAQITRDVEAARIIHNLC